MRVLSGIQPSGQLHLGNYFGSIQPNVELVKQSEESLYIVVDLHALTTLHDPAVMRVSRQEAVLDLLACGFDPAKAILFFQSDVAEHAELMWILATVSPMGLLERAVAYKEKIEKGIPASVALFAYPVLQAADILLYSADVVPVGKDQKQHLEIARDIAVKFNNTYGETLVVPTPLIRENVAVVPGTDGQKMSKSYGNTIPLFAPEGEVKKAVMGIVTDSKAVNEPKDPETCVIYQIHKLFLSAAEAQELADAYRNGLPYGDAKKRLLSVITDTFAPMRKKRSSLTKAYVHDVMQDGAVRARAIALETMAKVRKSVGLQ